MKGLIRELLAVGKVLGGCCKIRGGKENGTSNLEENASYHDSSKGGVGAGPGGAWRKKKRKKKKKAASKNGRTEKLS